MKIRPRRLRQNETIRNWCAETNLSSKDLIYPMFLGQSTKTPSEIASMPNRFRYGLSDLLKEIERLQMLGLNSVCLFPAVDENKKDAVGSYSYAEDNFYLDALSKIKYEFPDLTLMTDVALDPYSTDGHDGIVDSSSGEILNDETLKVLSKMSVAQAQAGADIIGPSDMMDGRVASIRSSLDESGFKNTMIMSYSAKYASAFYGPFRDALESAPKFGDKKTYQMDFRNKNEAIKEALLDQIEGADILMVKPALSYLDIIQSLKNNCNLPISAYQVSGEYSMIKAASQQGWIDEDSIVLETLTSIKRAGADVILSYFVPEVLEILK